MKKLLLSVAVIATMGFASCSSDAEADATDGAAAGKEVEDQAKKADGPLATVDYSEFKVSNTDKSYFKMVDGGKAKITFGEYDQLYVSTELEVIKTFTGKLGQYEAEQAFVSIVALDADGNTIKLGMSTNGEMRTNDSDGSQFADFLRGEPGYTAKFVFSGSISKEGSIDTDMGATEEAAKSIVGFKVLTDK